MNLTPDPKVIVQGITEQLGRFYTAHMKAYGTNIVAGVSPTAGGQSVEQIPVFDLVEQAVIKVGQVDISIICVSPYDVLDAALEAINVGIRKLVIITSGVPPQDIVHLLRKAETTKTLILGPGSSGIFIPDQVVIGTQKPQFYTPGTIGLISRSISLSYGVALELNKSGLGQSMSVCLGSDPIVGSSYVQWLEILAADKHTKGIVLIGQIDCIEPEVATYINEAIDKPVVAYIAGRYAVAEKQLIDPSILISSPLSWQVTDINKNTVQRQIATFKQAKIPLAERLSQIPELVKKALKSK